MERTHGQIYVRVAKSALFAAIMVLICGPSQAYSETGVTSDEILVGMSTALSGHTSFLGQSFRTGAESYLNAVNERGGVAGRKIKLIVYDDGYEPGKTLPNVNRLIFTDKVFCIFGNVGTPTTVAIMPVISGQKIPLFAPVTGAESLRDASVKYVLNYRASYNQETEEIVRGILDELDYRRIGVFYQNDSYGKAVLKGVRLALRKRGIDPAIAASYYRNTENIDLALKTIAAEKPQAVIMAGTYAACAKFIILGRKMGFNPVYANVSFVGPDKLAELLGAQGDKVVVTQVVPPFNDGNEGNYSAVGEYLAAIRKSSPDAKPNSLSLEGFLAAKVFVEVLKRAGNNLTRESFIASAERIKNLDIGAGNSIAFSSNNHQGSQKVYSTVIRSGKFRLLPDWNALK